MKAFISILFIISACFGAIQDYNISTWNMQGSSASTESKWNINVRQIITGNSASDILLIQEAGSLPLSARQTERVVQTGGIPIHEYTWNLGTTSRPNMVYIYYSRVDVGANRVNLAIITRRQADEVFTLTPPTALSRPIIGIRIGQDAFFTAHALANGGSDAPAIVQNVFDAFRGSPSTNWLIGGDFNRSPTSLLGALDQRVASRVSIISTNAPTQRQGGTLDYAVAGNSGSAAFLAPALSAVLLLANMVSQLASDHVPVNFRKF